LNILNLTGTDGEFQQQENKTSLFVFFDYFISKPAIFIKPKTLKDNSLKLSYVKAAKAKHSGKATKTTIPGKNDFCLH
jgi:hypothetical protein